jgi:hypothetical protein
MPGSWTCGSSQISLDDCELLICALDHKPTDRILTDGAANLASEFLQTRHTFSIERWLGKPSIAVGWHRRRSKRRSLADPLAEDELHRTSQVRIIYTLSPEQCSATSHAGQRRLARNDLAHKFLIRLEGTMSPRTLFLSRLIGLYCILAALSMITRKQATVETVTALLHNPLMIFIVGVITLAAGLAMVLAHNIWSGGALPVVVTLVGWVTLLKSLLLLFLPVDVEADFFLRQLHYPDLFYAYGGLSLVLGIYLTYSGFSPTSR